MNGNAKSNKRTVSGVLYRIAIMLLALAAASFIYNRTFSTSVPPRVNSAPVAEQSAVSSHSDEVIQQAFTQKKRALQVNGKGMVSRILADDNQGSRHQRFILKLASGQTLLIAHNIDLAARIDGLQLGDEVSFYGQYEYNDRGGVVHWTHHDPNGRHVAGWLKHRGKTYQ